MKNKTFEEELKTLLTEETPDVLSKIKQDSRFQLPAKAEKSSLFDIFKQNRLSYAFSSIFVLVLVVFGVLLSQTSTTEIVASTVTIDINPSVELLLNEDDEVIEINPINEDAEDLIEDQDRYKGMSLDTAIQNLMRNAINQGYVFEDNNYVLINVASENAERRMMVQEKLETAFTREAMRHHQPFDVRTMVSELTENAQSNARNNHMSVAKYELIQTIINATDAYAFEDLENASIRELFTILNEVHGDEGNFPPMGPPNNVPGPPENMPGPRHNNS